MLVKYIVMASSFLQMACVPPQAPPPVERVTCPASTPNVMLESCTRQLEFYEQLCNPYSGNTQNCDSWVIDRWYNQQLSCDSIFETW
jgi:hypothetical protein